MPTKCAYKQVNGDCDHPDPNRKCSNCVPTDETIANSMPKLAEDGKDGVTIEMIDYNSDDDMAMATAGVKPRLAPVRTVHSDDGKDGVTIEEVTPLVGMVMTDNRDPYSKNYGKNKAGEPEEADGVLRFTCYQCLHTVKWLNEDSRCKDCTRLTPEETRGDIALEEEE